MIAVSAVLGVLLGGVGAALVGGDADQQASDRLIGWLVAAVVSVLVASFIKVVVPAGRLPAVAGTQPSVGTRSGRAERIAVRLGLPAARTTTEDVLAVRCALH